MYYIHTIIKTKSNRNVAYGNDCLGSEFKNVIFKFSYIGVIIETNELIYAKFSKL